MKKFLFGSFAILSFCLSAWAQRNNPFDGFGKEFVTSIQIIDHDLNTGKIKQIDENTLNYYSKNIPLQNEINLTLASNVFKNLSNVSVIEVINKSEYSDFGKQILRKIIQKDDPISLVDEVIKSAISRNEKDNLLKLLAATYNLAFMNNQLERHTALGGGMYFIGGFLIGEAVCGPLCGAAGAVIGCFIEYIK